MRKKKTLLTAPNEGQSVSLEAPPVLSRESTDVLSPEREPVESVKIDEGWLKTPATVREGLTRWACPIYGGIGVSTFVSAFGAIAHHDAVNSVVVGLMGLACVIARNGRLKDH